MKRWSVTALALALALSSAGTVLGETSLDNAASEDAAIERGRYLTIAGGCLSCHTDADNDGAAFAGGHRLETPYGIFNVPNITPDAKTGIGNWSDTDFLTAMREGVSPDGDYYYPAFPYPSYAGLTEQDVLDIKAFLDSLEPVATTNQAHELPWYVPGRWAMGLWQMLFAPWDYATIPPQADPVWQRGAYLVRHLGHCGECHTPRNEVGALQLDQEGAGQPKQDDLAGAPDITPDKTTGIGQWAQEDIEFFLEIGMLPDGDFAGGGMAAVIDDNTSLLTPADRNAIAVYLQSLAATGDKQDADTANP